MKLKKDVHLGELIHKFRVGAIVCIMLVQGLVAVQYANVVSEEGGYLMGAIVFLVAIAAELGLGFFFHCYFPDRLAPWLIGVAGLGTFAVVLFFAAQSHVGMRSGVEDGGRRVSIMADLKTSMQRQEILVKEEATLAENPMKRGDLAKTRERMAENSRHIEALRSRVNSSGSSTNAGFKALTQWLQGQGFDMSIGEVTFWGWIFITGILQLMYAGLIISIPGQSLGGSTEKQMSPSRSQSFA